MIHDIENINQTVEIDQVSMEICESFEKYFISSEKKIKKTT